MSRRAITSLGIQLIGIYTLLQYLPALSQLFTMVSISLPNGTVPLSSALLPVGSGVIHLLWMGMCLLMIFKPGLLAALLCREDVTIVSGETFTLYDFQRLAFSIIGLLLIVKALPHAAGLVFQYQLMQTQYKDLPYPSMMPNLLSWIAQILVGLFLFFRPQSLAQLWAQCQGVINR